MVGGIKFHRVILKASLGRNEQKQRQKQKQTQQQQQQLSNK
jgi:hypothetical protein